MKYTILIHEFARATTTRDFLKSSIAEHVENLQLPSHDPLRTLAEDSLQRDCYELAIVEQELEAIAAEAKRLDTPKPTFWKKLFKK